MYIKTIIITIVILVLAGGGWLGYQWYSTNHFLSSVPTAQDQSAPIVQTTSSNQTVPTASIAPIPTNNTLAPTPRAASTQPPSTASVHDCGSVVSTDIYTAPGQADTMTAKENTSIACASHAFVACSPATFAITGYFAKQDMETHYRIGSSSNGYCPLSISVVQPPSSRVCQFPLNFIADIAKAARAQTPDETDKIFAELPFIFLTPSVTDIETGQKVTISCTPTIGS